VFAVSRRQYVNDVQQSSNPPSVRFTPQEKGSNKMKINTVRKSGFTLVEIMIVVAIIGLLAAIAIPNFVKARQSSQENACVANLKQIEGAKANWAMEQKKTNAAVPGDGDLFGDTAYIRVKPACPASGVYALNAVDARPTCTIGGAHVLP
jgi:prepilin-type N-terminal cleavage/methylation domain-containing protein